MKVRLKHVSSLQSGLCDYMFQFHEGPIKTLKYNLTSKVCLLFQFHEGPIKTRHSLLTRIFSLCFNSMKVRLKRVMSSENVVKMV